MDRTTSASGRVSLPIGDPGREQVLLDERAELRAAAFDDFVRALDTEEPRELPVLRRYARPA